MTVPEGSGIFGEGAGFLEALRPLTICLSLLEPLKEPALLPFIKEPYSNNYKRAKP